MKKPQYLFTTILIGLMTFISLESTVFAKMTTVSGIGIITHGTCPEGAKNWDDSYENIIEVDYCINIDFTGKYSPSWAPNSFYTFPNKYLTLDTLEIDKQYYFRFTIISLTGRSPIEDYDGVEVYPAVEIPAADFDDPPLTDFSAYYNPFPDTDLNSLEGKAAAELYRRTAASGYEYLESKYPDGSFLGYRLVNRAEAAKFLLRTKWGDVESEEGLNGNGDFPDIELNAWYQPYVVKAVANGIIHGYPDGFFRPEQTVNTVEFLKMLTKTFNLQENLSHSYEDVIAGSWYEKYAGIADRYKLFPERGKKLEPGRHLTRDEIAVAIYQYLLNRAGT